MTFVAATGMASWPIIKQIAWILGFLMRGIYIVLTSMNIYSITLCIVLFTVITRMLLLPLTIQQQKFTKLNAVMSPELQALQKKYAGKKDQASMQKMQMEQQLIYDKYGASMTAGCLPSLLQIVLLFALYPVVYNLEQYVPELAKVHASDPALFERMYTFFGISLNETPKLGLNPSILIPILAGAAQFISTQLMMVNQPSSGNSNDNPMASSMKTMNYTMPLMSVVFCFTFPAFIGIYWVIMSVVMIIQQLIINKHLQNLDVDEMIRQNVEKKNKKRKKKGLPPLSEKATMQTKKINSMNTAPARQEKTAMDPSEREAKIKAATDYYNSRTAKPGSLAAKANMVKEYNEKHSKK